ncbi:MAG: amidoligase family protein [Christensenellaceae bacterium]|jgi:hypothetical protein|nr:amidoligase family protein [Christensenellaceae bacterium]
MAIDTIKIKNLKSLIFRIKMEIIDITILNAKNIVADVLNTKNILANSTLSEYRVVPYKNNEWCLETVEAPNRIVNQYIKLITPCCKYDDIELINKVICLLHAGGANINNECNLHIEILNGSYFTSTNLITLVSLMASKEQLLFKTVGVHDIRRKHLLFTNDNFLNIIIKNKKLTLDELKKHWFEQTKAINEMKTYALDLNCFWKAGSVEFTFFNSTFNTDEIKAYIDLCLSIVNHAKSITHTNSKSTTPKNESYKMHNWITKSFVLNGNEFRTTRDILTKKLDGNVAWKTIVKSISSDHKYYIAYGSNLNHDQMLKDRCPTAKYIGKSTLQDYELVFRRTATIEKCLNSKVPVGIFEIDKKCEVTLDSREGVLNDPPSYERILLTFKLNGKSHEGLCYIKKMKIMNFRLINILIKSVLVMKNWVLIKNIFIMPLKKLKNILKGTTRNLNLHPRKN